MSHHPVSQGESSGFTLIELLMVVFIIAVLAAIAIPSYLSYASRSQISESFSQATPVRRLVEEYWYISGEFPTTREEAGIDPPVSYQGKFVDRIALGEDGRVEVTFGPSAVEGGVIFFTPVIQAVGLDWVCSSPNIRPALLPKECR